MGELQSKPNYSDDFEIPEEYFKDRILNNYKCQKMIGYGKFGQVYIVLHIPTNKEYAMKIQLKDGYPYAFEDIKKEIEFMESTNHIKETINFYESFEDEKHVFIVMELCDVGSLAHFLVKYGAFKPSSCIDLFEQICTGVKKIHQLGIIHRDLKPLNILVAKKNDECRLDPDIFEEESCEGLGEKERSKFFHQSFFRKSSNYLFGK